ncbi:MAG: hypothetical protein ACI82I_002314 [Gammaproteobacteria bacterium]|jgi:hypothetical protein
MIRYIHSQPISDVSKRRRIILKSSTFTIFAALPICSLITFISAFIEDMQFGGDQSLTMILFEGLLLGPMIWLFVLIFVVPSLLVTWPIANLALRNGSAGLLVSLGCGVLVGALAFTIPILLNGDDVPIVYIVVGAVCGTIFSGLYWVGGYRANRAVFK